MPGGFNPTLSTITILGSGATFAGSGFADFQFSLAGGDVWLSDDGGSTKIHGTVTSWADGSITAQFVAGAYTSGGVVSGDGEASNTLTGTYTVAKSKTGSRRSLSLSLSLSL